MSARGAASTPVGPLEYTLRLVLGYALIAAVVALGVYLHPERMQPAVRWSGQPSDTVPDNCAHRAEPEEGWCPIMNQRDI